MEQAEMCSWYCSLPTVCPVGTCAALPTAVLSPSLRSQRDRKLRQRPEIDRSVSTCMISAKSVPASLHLCALQRKRDVLYNILGQGGLVHCRAQNVYIEYRSANLTHVHIRT